MDALGNKWAHEGNGCERGVTILKANNWGVSLVVYLLKLSGCDYSLLRWASLAKEYY